jgi:hypothetical protein
VNPPTPLTAGLRALQFAEGLLGRCRVERLGGRLELALRLWPAPERPVYAPVTTRLFLSLQPPHPAAARPRPPASSPARDTGENSFALPAAHPALVYRERIERVHEVFLRLEGRGRRLEPSGRRPRVPLQAAAGTQELHPGLLESGGGRLVFHRLHAAQEGSPSAVPAGARPLPYPARSAAVQLAGSPPAQFDVERLADQVVSAIDRRILARRERTGRF